jgi:hypothetical protein
MPGMVRHAHLSIELRTKTRKRRVALPRNMCWSSIAKATKIVWTGTQCPRCVFGVGKAKSGKSLTF